MLLYELDCDRLNDSMILDESSTSPVSAEHLYVSIISSKFLKLAVEVSQCLCNWSDRVILKLVHAHTMIPFVIQRNMVQ